MTGVNDADPAENQTYSAEVELKGNEVNLWPIFMLYYAV